MTGVKALAPQIHSLEAKIVQASKAGATDASLKEDVNTLASLRAQATMIHLSCIYETRKILTKDQIYMLE